MSLAAREEMVVSTSVPTAIEMRRAMSSFASGVTIVTGHDEAGPVGFACQSFASVSLEPPLVLFCADHGGRAWPRIRETGRFCVNVLGEEQTDLCARFGSSRGAKFEGLDWELSAWGSPALPEVLCRVHAEVETVHLAGDHDIVVGRVLSLEQPVDDSPLVFFRGRFGTHPDSAFVLPNLYGWDDHWD